jgi:hypothetical protein
VVLLDDELGGTSVRGSLVHIANPREDGTSYAAAVPPGRHVVAAYAEDGACGRRVVDVEAHETAEVELPIGPRVRLTLHYEGRRGFARYRLIARGETVSSGTVPMGKPQRMDVLAEPLELSWIEIHPRFAESLPLQPRAGDELELAWRGSP